MTTAVATQSRSILRLIDDYPAFSGFTGKVQADVLAKLRWIDAHIQAPPKQKGLVVKQAAKALRKSEGAVNRYIGWYKEFGWKGLVDERYRGVGAKGLPEKFKSYVAGIFDALQRGDDGKEAHRQLIDRVTVWRTTGNPDYAIPGYSFPPDLDPATGEPHGWSYDNLLKLRPKKPARVLAKQGPKAASVFLPSVISTRVGSAVLSRVLFDDQELDNLTQDGHLAIAGITEAQKPVSFNSLDFYTAAHLDQHLRLKYKDPDSGKDKTLSGMEFNWFTIHHLQTQGYRTDAYGTEIVQEHGTAKTWQNESLTSLGGFHSFEDALFALTGEKVYMNRSGKFDSPLMEAMCFKPSPSGNFRFKTWLESAFRLLRTYMQSLPGATGSRERDNGREETYGIRLVERGLLTSIFKAADPGTQDFLREYLCHELMDLPTFYQIILAIYRAVNARTEHNLEGWSQCGFTVPLWRPSPESESWFTQEELRSIPDPDERRLMIMRVNSNPRLLTKIDKLSPAAVLGIELRRDAAHIAKLRNEYVGLLIPLEHAVKRKVGSDHCFTIPNPLWPDTQEMYVASWDHKGAQITLDARKELFIFHDPFGDGIAHLHDLNGAYITTLHPTVRAEPFRQDKILVQLAQRSAIKSGHEAELKARLANIAAGRVHNRTVNKVCLDLTREDRKRSANAAQAAGKTASDVSRASHGRAADEALACIGSAEEQFSDDIDF